MDRKLTVSPSPHLRCAATTRSVMLDVCIALIPALVAASIIFSLRALLVTAVSVISCLLFEHLFCLIVKWETTIGDLSAVVTGILLSFNLPVTVPIYIVIIGAFVSIVVVKMLFGGIGQNFVNPALIGRIVLMMSFPAQMTNWVVPFYYQAPDAVTSATALSVIKSGEGTLPSLLDMFLGVRGGCLGETCALALILGFIYLLIRKVITPIIPLCYVGTVALFALISNGFTDMVLYQILGGGLLLGAIFMATDYTTSPVTNSGKVIFGIGCGLITTLIRMFGSYAEGVSFAIILMNIIVPYIARITNTKPMGGAKA